MSITKEENSAFIVASNQNSNVTEQLPAEGHYRKFSTQNPEISKPVWNKIIRERTNEKKNKEGRQARQMRHRLRKIDYRQAKLDQIDEHQQDRKERKKQTRVDQVDENRIDRQTDQNQCYKLF